jgi:hypothetical protein
MPARPPHQAAAGQAFMRLIVVPSDQTPMEDHMGLFDSIVSNALKGMMNQQDVQAEVVPAV